MQSKSASWGLPILSALFLTYFLAPAVAAAQAELRPMMTSHVTDAVVSGVAPMVGHLPAQQRLSLALSLPLRNQQELELFLQDLYNPDSPTYHRYLTVAQFAERYGATEQDYNSVIQFAEANHLKVMGKGANRLVVDVEGSVADVEAAFHTSLALFQHPTEGRT